MYLLNIIPRLCTSYTYIIMSEDKTSIIMLSVLAAALLFVGISHKFNSLLVDVIAVLFLLVSTAVGAAIVTERRIRRRKSAK